MVFFRQIQDLETGLQNRPKRYKYVLEDIWGDDKDDGYQYACVFCHTLGMLHCFYTSHMQLVYQLISSTVVMLLTILTVAL